MLVILAAGGGFRCDDRGRILGASLGDIKHVMEPIIAWGKYWLVDSERSESGSMKRVSDSWRGCDRIKVE